MRMQYTKLILAFVVVLVIVTMVGSLRCDSYSDINDPLTLSDEFAGQPCNSACQEKRAEEAKKKEKARTDEIIAYMTSKVPSLKQDGVSLFTGINFNKEKNNGKQYDLGDVPFEKETQISSSVDLKNPGSAGGSLYKMKSSQPWSAYIAPGYKLDVYYYKFRMKPETDPPSRTYYGGSSGKVQGGFFNLETNDCKPCVPAYYVRVTKVGGSSDKSTQSTSSGTCMPHDTATYKYRTRKKYGNTDNDWRCPKGWEDTGCQNPDKRQCRAKRDNKQNVDGSKSSKDAIRKKCDKMARKHEGVFAVCKDVKGGKRRDCLGKRGGPMEKCLRDEHKRENQSHGSSSDTSLMLYYDAAFGGHPMPFTGYAAMNLSKVDRKQASSAKVSPGFKAVLFSGTNFKGKSTTLTEGQYSSMPSGWDDRVSSVSIKKA